MRTVNYYRWLSIVLVLIGASPASGVPLDLVLRLGNASITGPHDVRIALYDAPTSISPIATPVEFGVMLQGGIGFVSITLPTNASPGNTWIGIESRRTGAGLPYAALPLRYRAELANMAASAEQAATADTVLPESVDSSGVADNAVGALQVDLSAIQARVAGVCAANAAAYQINTDGSVACRDLPVGPKGDLGAPGPAVFTEGVCTGNASSGNCGCKTVIGTIFGRSTSFCYVGGDIGGCGYSVSGGTSLCCLCLHRP